MRNDETMFYYYANLGILIISTYNRTFIKLAHLLNLEISEIQKSLPLILRNEFNSDTITTILRHCFQKCGDEN